MRKLLTITLSFVLVLGSNLLVTGQEDHPLSARVIDSLKASEPRWSLDSIDHFPYSEDMRSEILILRWKNGEEHVGAVVLIYLLPEDADETYEAWSSPRGQFIQKWHKVVEKNLLGVGDESRLWRAENEDDCQLYFRKGKTVAFVEAPSIEVGKAFARRIAAELAAT